MALQAAMAANSSSRSAPNFQSDITMQLQLPCAHATVLPLSVCSLPVHPGLCLSLKKGTQTLWEPIPSAYDNKNRWWARNSMHGMLRITRCRQDEQEDAPGGPGTQCLHLWQHWPTSNRIDKYKLPHLLVSLLQCCSQGALHCICLACTCLTICKDC